MFKIEHVMADGSTRDSAEDIRLEYSQATDGIFRCLARILIDEAER